MKEWKNFNDECPQCGSEAEVLTDAPEYYAYDGDEARCCECGLKGGVIIDDGADYGHISAWVDWNDFEDE